MRRKLSLSDNKYSRGVVAVAAGSERYPGAALLAVGGARRGNAGYVKFCSRSQRLHTLVVAQYPDVVPIEELEGERIDSLVVGPGGATLLNLPPDTPLVLDGESIGEIVERGFSNQHPITVITPHEGELKFCGIEAKTPLTSDERKQIALQLARNHGVIVVLKGHRTVVAEPEGETFVDEIGGPELATAGSGDILAGLIGSFIVHARDKDNAMDLVSRAVTLHSRAGRLATEKFTSVTALDILDSLAHV